MAGLLAVAAVPAVAPQWAEAQSYSFQSVQVEGNQRIEAGTILSYADIRQGETVTAGRLNDAYQAILNSGLFQSVELVPSGSTLVIRVQEYPTVSRINIEGNRRLSDEELLTLVGTQQRRVYSPNQAEADAAAIADAYRQSGRLAASVTPRIIPRDGNRVDLVFEVAEGRIVENERISFVGNRAFSDRRLRRVLQTKQAGLLRRFIRRDTFIAERIPFDQQVLSDFYQSRGYVDFRITDVATEFSRERNASFITFAVQEGQSYDFGQVSASSNLPGIDIADFRRVIRMRSGMTYSPTRLENTIARMERLALQQGYDFVRVDPVITRNDRNLTLDVDFMLVRGPRIFVERIDIEGNATTLDRVIRRQFRVVEGDPFNPRQIRQAAERIRALGYFASTEVNARQGTAADQVIVDVDVEEQPTGSLSFGASYGADAGFGLAASFTERNFLGRGQTVQLEFTTGADSNSGRFRFVEPALLGRDLSGGINIFYSETDQADVSYDTRRAGISPSLSFPVSENGRLALRYTYAQEEITDVVSDSLIVREEAGDLTTSSVGYTYTYDTRRTGLNPNAGVLFRFGQDYAGVGGDNEYILTTAEITGQAAVLNEEVTLRATLEGGALNFLNGESRSIDRFFLSSRQFRGFASKGIGPRDLLAETEDALGGNYYAVARLETEFPVGLPEEYGIMGGAFVDVGSVWGLDDTSGGSFENGTAGDVDDSFNLRASIGVSVFWDTAIGPLRFNFAKPLVEEDFDETRTFDVTISTQF